MEEDLRTDPYTFAYYFLEALQEYLSDRSLLTVEFFGPLAKIDPPGSLGSVTVEEIGQALHLIFEIVPSFLSKDNLGLLCNCFGAKDGRVNLLELHIAVNRLGKKKARAKKQAGDCQYSFMFVPTERRSQAEQHAVLLLDNLLTHLQKNHQYFKDLFNTCEPGGHSGDSITFPDFLSVLLMKVK